MWNSCAPPCAPGSDLEMAATSDMEAIALRHRPDMVTLVPEPVT
jgi:pyridoxine 5'-phosphate synthase PdxJ